MFKYFYLITLLILVLPVASAAQDQSNSSVDIAFSIYSTSSNSYWNGEDVNEPPELVKINAYKVASGFASGIKFHYETSRDKLSLVEEVSTTVDLKYLGSEEVENGRKYNYSVSLPQETVDDAKKNISVTSHGESDNNNFAIAREEARTQALDEAVRHAMSQAYVRKGKVMPGNVSGTIAWYEITGEEYDRRQGAYSLDLNAWVYVPVIDDSKSAAKSNSSNNSDDSSNNTSDDGTGDQSDDHY
jgi:hypothetical protein